jgi:hypothetical protein
MNERHASQAGRDVGQTAERARRSDVPEEACRVVHGGSDMSKSSMAPFNGILWWGCSWNGAARSAARGLPSSSSWTDAKMKSCRENLIQVL